MSLLPCWTFETEELTRASVRNPLDFSSSPAHRQKDVSDASEPLNRTLILILLAIRLISARINRIEDCDETFNYWEASHFLQHGYGLQTWEYSPVYAIRSWSYAGLHAVLGVGFELVTLGLLGKVGKFGNREPLVFFVVDTSQLPTDGHFLLYSNSTSLLLGFQRDLPRPQSLGTLWVRSRQPTPRRPGRKRRHGARCTRLLAFFVCHVYYDVCICF